MPTIQFINSSNIENDVSATQQLPTSAIDGYTNATAYVATVPVGGNAVTLTSVVGAKAIDLFNNTGVDLAFARGASTVFFPIPNGTFRSITALGGNANAVSIKMTGNATQAASLIYEVLS